MSKETTSKGSAPLPHDVLVAGPSLLNLFAAID
jgi:hypothetical protein